MPLHDQIFPSNSLKTCVPVSNANVGLWCFNDTFQQYFSYIVAVSFIGGRNWSTQRKQTTQIWQSKHLYYLLTIFKGLIKHVWQHALTVKSVWWHASTVKSVFETGAQVKLAVNLKEKLDHENTSRSLIFLII